MCRQDKELYFIMAAADEKTESLERTVEGFRGFASCLSGAREKGIIYGTGVWDAGAIKGRPAMDQACHMGKYA
jgi:hypothetical protein